MKSVHEGGADDADLVTALRLMRLALPLLDRARHDLAVARLQYAIDEAETGRIPTGRVDGILR